MKTHKLIHVKHLVQGRAHRKLLINVTYHCHDQELGGSVASFILDERAGIRASRGNFKVPGRHTSSARCHPHPGLCFSLGAQQRPSPEPEAPSPEGGWRYGNSERHPVEGFQEAALLRVNICPALGLALSITASGPSHSGHCTTISGTRFH